jgi:hypothetical protein
MGIPYSREINAAFEQVTPLVAAGFKVLKTTRNISILLAVIQVLTVLLLGLILGVGLLLCYSLNPDLEVHPSNLFVLAPQSYILIGVCVCEFIDADRPQQERKQIATPFLRWLASITIWSIVKGVVSTIVGTGIALGGAWWVFDRMGVEREGNEDADKALEGMDGEAEEKEGKGKGKKSKQDEEDSKEGKK